MNINIESTWALWIFSYITERQFSVRIKGNYSQYKTMSSGVPQGSNLGPLLFLLYINDLPTYIQNASLLILADDCKVYHTINNPSDRFALQTDINNFAIWSHKNHLPLQINKCQVVHFHRKKEPLLYSYVLAGKKLKEVQSIKDLGITFNFDLNFSKHIELTPNKAMQKLGWIKRTTRSFSDTEVIKILFNTYVKPTLTFSSSIWSPYFGSDTKNLESVNHVFLRYISWKGSAPMSYRDHDYHNISTSESIYTIISTHKYFDSIYAFKIARNILPSNEIISLFTPVSENLNTRSKRAVHTPFKHYNYSYNSAILRLRRMWNSLLKNVLESESIVEFMRHSRKLNLKFY